MPSIDVCPRCHGDGILRSSGDTIERRSAFEHARFGRPISGSASAKRAHQRSFARYHESARCHERAPYRGSCRTPREPAVRCTGQPAPILPTRRLAEWFRDKKTPAVSSKLPRNDQNGRLDGAGLAQGFAALRASWWRSRPAPAPWCQPPPIPSFGQKLLTIGYERLSNSGNRAMFAATRRASSSWQAAGHSLL
jgi:hypothetical protein